MRRKIRLLRAQRSYDDTSEEGEPVVQINTSEEELRRFEKEGREKIQKITRESSSH